jgi:arylsulfatase A-like enzyme
MRRWFLALFAACGFAFEADAEEPRRPNVVLIVADDLGWADLGCYGSKYHKTPNLDRLATQGLRFTDAYAAAPVCSPSRAAILTGMYPARLNLTDWLPGRPDRPDQKLLRPKIATEIPADVSTLPEILRLGGYTCGHVGKWHLGGKGASPTDRGFHVNIAGDHTGTPLSYFAPFKDRAGRFMPGLEQAPDGEYLTDRLTDEAVKFIKTNRDKPFFLYLAHYAVHIPLKAKEALTAKYKPGKPGEQGNPLYAAMIESLDESVGRVLKELDEQKLNEKTLVIFTSDNGGLCTLEGPNTPPTINAPLREGKGYLYEGGIRVPLIIRGPGIAKPGRAVGGEPVSSIDIRPTIMDACGLPSATHFDGKSLISAFHQWNLGVVGLKRALCWHYPHYSNQGGRPGGAVMWGLHKLIEFYDTGSRELYDRHEDPGERTNLADRYPQIVESMAVLLDRWRKDVGAKMPTPNPNYLPNPQAKDGTITLPARTADVHGVQLRYEPLPHKNTLGYWTRTEDWASWEFTVTTPGKFALEILQGCGQGQGGSEVQLSVGDQKLTFTVEDTGHFQNFKPRDVGTLMFARPGRYTLEVRPLKKAAAAVMDLRQVMLKPVR